MNLCQSRGPGARRGATSVTYRLPSVFLSPADSHVTVDLFDTHNLERVFMASDFARLDAGRVRAGLSLIHDENDAEGQARTAMLCAQSASSQRKKWWAGGHKCRGCRRSPTLPYGNRHPAPERRRSVLRMLRRDIAWEELDWSGALRWAGTPAA